MRNVLYVIMLTLVFYSQPLKAMEHCFIQDTTGKGTNASSSFPKSKLGIDILVLMTGEQREVEIRKFSQKYIFFSKYAESNMTQVDRRLVNIIYYRSGKKEVITPKAVDIPQNNDWEKIKVTENPKDVKMMIEIDVIEVVVEASTREQYVKPQTLENSAYIILKKKAAMLNGELVLIKKKSHSRPYGEAPSLRIVAFAYRKI